MSEIKSNTDVQPWMTELWAWADKFKIHEEVLPRDHANLLVLTDLSIDFSQLTKLPESIRACHQLSQTTQETK